MSEPYDEAAASRFLAALALEFVGPDHPAGQPFDIEPFLEWINANGKAPKLASHLGDIGPALAGMVTLLQFDGRLNDWPQHELIALIERIVANYLIAQLAQRARASSAAREARPHPDRELWESLRAQHADSHACDIATADALGLTDAALDKKVKALAEARRRAKANGKPWQGDD